MVLRPSSHLDSHVVVRAVEVPNSPELNRQWEVYLSEPDLKRASQFRQEADKARFILGRQLLARALNEFCGLAGPGVPELGYTSAGRPFLIEMTDLQFNLTHAGTCVAMALALRADIGIDVESITRPVNLDSVAKRIFNAEDLRQFLKVPQREKARRFFQAWTAKEAWLKARGIGITTGLEEASVPLEINLAPRALASTSGETWMLQGLPVPEDYCGNVVWNDPTKSVDFAWIEL